MRNTMILIKNKTVKLIIAITHQLRFILDLHLHQRNHYFDDNCGGLPDLKYQKAPSKIDLRFFINCLTQRF